MGNYNSGRRADTPSTDDCVRISLSELRREGAVKRHCMANRTHRWAIGGDLVSNLLLTVDIDCLAPSPCLRIRGKAFGRQIDQTIDIVAMPQPLGGERFYLVCPITGQRCLTVILPPGTTTFASVCGWGVPYGSTRERSFDRALRAADMAEKRYRRLSKYTRRPTREMLLGRLVAAETAIHEIEDSLMAPIRIADHLKVALACDTEPYPPNQS